MGEHHVKEEYEGYPDLPSPRQIVRDISPKQCQQVVSPCAPITASAPTSVPTSESRTRSPARQSDSDDIVAQLISENTRLNDEVQRLMVMVQAAQYRQPQAPQQTQRVPQQQQQQEEVQLPQVQEELQGQQKYVCCGTCRQWLQAPHDAQMVRCPGCGCINSVILPRKTLPESKLLKSGACMTLCKSSHNPLTSQRQLQPLQQGQWQAMAHGGAHMQSGRRHGEDEISELIPSFMQDCLGGLWNAGAHLLNNSSSDWRHPRRHTEAPPGDSTIFREGGLIVAFLSGKRRARTSSTNFSK